LTPRFSRQDARLVTVSRLPHLATPSVPLAPLRAQRAPAKRVRSVPPTGHTADMPKSTRMTQLGSGARIAAVETMMIKCRRGDASLNRCGGAHCYRQGLIVTRAGFRRRLSLSVDYQTDFALRVLQYRIEPPRRKFRYAEPALIFRCTPTFVILSAGMPIKKPGLTWTNKNQLRGPLIRPSGQGLQRGRAGSLPPPH
jgi:hypothetical protein